MNVYIQHLPHGQELRVASPSAVLGGADEKLAHIALDDGAEMVQVVGDVVHSLLAELAVQPLVPVYGLADGAVQAVSIGDDVEAEPALVPQVFVLLLHLGQKNYRIQEDTDSSLAASWKVLIKTLQEKESKIQKLEAELQEYQENEDTKMIIFDNDDDNEKNMLEKENEDFREEVSRLLDRISHLEESLKRSEKENNKLDKEVRGMQLKMEKDEKTVQKLIEAQEKIKMELEKERSLNQSMLKEQKDIETKVEKKLSDLKEKIPALKEKDTKKKETVKSGSEITVPHESRESQKGYHKQQQKKSPSYKEAEKRALLAEIEKLKISEDQEKQHIQRYWSEFLRHSFNSINILTFCGFFYFSLKNEVEQINRSWAKKFQILKKSLHAIKDEMFLRHTLYRQAAAFNHASLNQPYAVPLYIETGARQINERRGGLYFPFSPLPQIRSESTAAMEETDLNIVKIPTGTEMCCLYEDVSGDEEFVGGPPFPSPPSTLT
uniref:Uncharacterized protein n=1 Tax=Chrysemys picta bellii TaxID=8478 RepID=A0A8C3HP18_CHRPI